MSLNGQRVVVVGGTSGIGFAVADAAGQQGAEVVVVSSGTKKVEDALARLGPRTRGHVVDVTDEHVVERFFTDLGNLDHLAFTAGDWGGRTPVELHGLDLDQARALFDVRFWGALTTVKHAYRSISAGGSITLTDGMVAHRPRKGSPLASAVAGATEHLVGSLALDLAPVRVNAVCPGLVLTEIWSGTPEEQRRTQIRTMTERFPLPRIGQPAEIAEAYLYLMRGGYTTGQVLQVDGGRGLV
jgi:NAD(P)-dependent dehydrogenase (short-subunit alcohol dehydrogenase family)